MRPTLIRDSCLPHGAPSLPFRTRPWPNVARFLIGIDAKSCVFPALKNTDLTVLRASTDRNRQGPDRECSRASRYNAVPARAGLKTPAANTSRPPVPYSWNAGHSQSAIIVPARNVFDCERCFYLFVMRPALWKGDNGGTTCHEPAST